MADQPLNQVSRQHCSTNYSLNLLVTSKLCGHEAMLSVVDCIVRIDADGVHVALVDEVGDAARMPTCCNLDELLAISTTTAGCAPLVKKCFCVVTEWTSYQIAVVDCLLDVRFGRMGEPLIDTGRSRELVPIGLPTLYLGDFNELPRLGG